MSATVWIEVESGSDRGSTPRRSGYCSGNQGAARREVHPTQQSRPGAIRLAGAAHAKYSQRLPS